ncbi:MAG: hypothetical protein Q8Q42_02160 [Nanoarchaeota archaeon]|nr:hypothetical protein [Nanoarchaeota archaeon]
MVRKSELVSDQKTLMCRSCREEQRHYRIGDGILDESGRIMAEFQCIGCMEINLILVGLEEDIALEDTW